MEKEKFYRGYYLTKSKYENNGRIYLGLENEEESFCDITINLSAMMIEDENVIFIDSWCSEFTDDLEELGLFKIIDNVQYNFGRYKKAILNMKVVNKFALEF